jgi:phage terminase large subunit-like protein
MNLAEYQSKARDLAALRQRCRTDLPYLISRVLCYGSRKPIPGMEKAYSEVFKNIQQFKGGTDVFEVKANGAILHRGYKPKCQMWELKGKRNNMVLIPRNHLKSTLVTVAHTIQWVLNYPDVRIRLVAAKNDQVEGFLREIKEHFVSNPVFRQIFPEYCPKMNRQGKVEDFGNQSFFTVPNRRINAKEPTVSVLSHGSVVSSTHFDVLITDDLVDIENSKTAEMIASVKLFFDMLMPLIERNPMNSDERGWLYVVGTRYSHSDIYGAKIEEAKRTQDWNIVCEPAWKEVNGERVAFWPERMSLKALDGESAQMSSFAFRSQYLQDPSGEGQGIATPEQIVWVPKERINEIRPRLREFVCSDLASLDDVKKNKSDYSAIVHGGWDTDGRLYIIDVRHGRFTDSEAIEHYFDLALRNPRIIYFKFQKDLISSTFMPSLKREMFKRNIYFNVDWVSVAGQNKEKDRIRHLEPLFKQGNIRFCEPFLSVKEESRWADIKYRLTDEITKFPQYVHDDIIDAIADFLMHRNEGSLDSLPNAAPDYASSPISPQTMNHVPAIQSGLHNFIFGIEEYVQ